MTKRLKKVLISPIAGMPIAATANIKKKIKSPSTALTTTQTTPDSTLTIRKDPTNSTLIVMQREHSYESNGDAIDIDGKLVIVNQPLTTRSEFYTALSDTIQADVLTSNRFETLKRDLLLYDNDKTTFLKDTENITAAILQSYTTEIYIASQSKSYNEYKVMEIYDHQKEQNAGRTMSRVQNWPEFKQMGVIRARLLAKAQDKFCNYVTKLFPDTCLTVTTSSTTSNITTNQEDICTISHRQSSQINHQKNFPDDDEDDNHPRQSERKRNATNIYICEPIPSSYQNKKRHLTKRSTTPKIFVQTFTYIDLTKESPVPEIDQVILDQFTG
jgi:hypothetical protein